MVKETKIETSAQYILENDKIRITLLSYGARITEFIFEGTDILLGYDSLADVKKSELYTGATVGRFANRVAGGRFTLNGVEYDVGCNENGVTHLHGGFSGFDRKEWDGEIVGENAVRFSTLSPDGDMGYPGNLKVSVTYTLEEDGFALFYQAESDKDTLLSVTNHAYFNLAGYDGGDCREMELQIQAKHYLPVDEDLIPTGEIKAVQGTEFDYTSMRKVDDSDHCFVLGMDRKYRPAARLFSAKTGLQLEVFTDLPGLQMYSCGGFSDVAGKGGIPLHDRQGVALETQFFPDTPNKPHFPSAVLKAGNIFESTTKYSVTRNGK